MDEDQNRRKGSAWEYCIKKVNQLRRDDTWEHFMDEVQDRRKASGNAA